MFCVTEDFSWLSSSASGLGKVVLTLPPCPWPQRSTEDPIFWKGRSCLVGVSLSAPVPTQDFWAKLRVPEGVKDSLSFPFLLQCSLAPRLSSLWVPLSFLSPPIFLALNKDQRTGLAVMLICFMSQTLVEFKLSCQLTLEILGWADFPFCPFVGDSFSPPMSVMTGLFTLFSYERLITFWILVY